MRAVSLHQPWATAVAFGLKSIETRAMRINHRGDLAICAAKLPPEDWEEYVEEYDFPASPPLGCIVAIVDVYDCRPTSHLINVIGDTERAFGNFKPGRWGWMLRNIRPLATPVPVRGQQGTWTLTTVQTALAYEQADVAYRAHSAYPGRSVADYTETR